MQSDIVIDTRGTGLYEFTSEVRRMLAERGDGVLTLMVQHTSASLLVQENADPDVQTDLQAFFDRLVPPANDPSMAYLRHTMEGPDDMPAHIKAAMMPVSLSLPVRAGIGHLAGDIPCRTSGAAASPKGRRAFSRRPISHGFGHNIWGGNSPLPKT